MSIRAITDTDRGAVSDLLHGRTSPIDDPQMRLHVFERDGTVEGVSVWWPTSEERGELVINTLASVGREAFYDLALAACEDAIASGYTEATFNIRRLTLLSTLQADFNVEARPNTWNAVTGRPIRWEVSVNLEDARAQLLSRRERR